jgi:hypothetical protein
VKITKIGTKEREMQMMEQKLPRESHGRSHFVPALILAALTVWWKIPASAENLRVCSGAHRLAFAQRQVYRSHFYKTQ